MSFIESPRFPEDVGVGAVGGPTFLTRMSIALSGHEQRNPKWSVARMRYNVTHHVNTQGGLETVVAYFRAMQGRAHAFRFKDWQDFETDADSGYFNLAGVGNYGLPTATLQKYYQTGSLEALREITKPSTVAGILYAGASISLIPAVDYTSGIVTFSSFALDSIASVTIGSSLTTLTLSAALADDLTVGQRLFVNSVLGSVGSYMNNTALQITSHSGAAYTVALDTTTPTLVYSGGGYGAHYPQETSTLRWLGEYDVPVRFDMDQMKVTLEAGYFRLWNEIELVEIKVNTTA